MGTTNSWSNLTVGNPAIDAAHTALFDQMLCMLTGPDSELAAGFLSLVELLERDFRAEETLMEGIDFSDIRQHREEHARVLSASHHVDPDNAAQAREVLRLLLQWFPAHVATMDAALVAALRHGAPAAGRTVADTPSAEDLRLMADTLPGEGPGD